MNATLRLNQICIIIQAFVTCKRVFITSAGVTKDAAGIPAIAPAHSKVKGWLYPFSSANDCWKWLINLLKTASWYFSVFVCLLWHEHKRGSIWRWMEHHVRNKLALLCIDRKVQDHWPHPTHWLYDHLRPILRRLGVGFSRFPMD